MTSFTRTWDASYEALPADVDIARDGAGRIRQIKLDTRERLGVDHSLAGDANDGAHKKVTLLEQAADPSLAANTGYIYTKDVAGVTEAFYRDSAGAVTQLTTAGKVDVPQALPVGSVYIAVVATNPASLLGYGTWAAFATGRMLIGLNAGNALFDTAEETGGSADTPVVAHTHTGTTGGQSADHTHTQDAIQVIDVPAAAFPWGRTPGAGNATSGASNDHTHNFTTNSSGSSGADANYPPFIAVYMWKRTA